jgi:hypothetical protein
MSNALAIATVTATLQQMLSGSLSRTGLTGAYVTSLRPDAPTGLPKPGVNVFLYQVTPNTSWRNADLPTRRADGTLLRRPQVAVDLHYLLTFYGDDVTLDQQRLLGAVVSQLHAAPVLDRNTIRQAQNLVAVLKDADLAEQIELVRVRPANLSLDELSRLWVIFPTIDYVLSAVYVAGVVLIETADAVPAPAPPPLGPSVTAPPLPPAVIDAVEPQAVELSLSPPTTITLLGRNLDPGGEVGFTTPGGAAPLIGTIEPGPSGTRLLVGLPLVGLHPGVNTVRLTLTAPSGVPRVLSQSNAAVFLLRPTLVSIIATSPPGQLVVVVSPPVGSGQRVSLLLTGLTGHAAFTLPAVQPASPPSGPDTDTFYFSTADVPGGGLPRGTYLARVRVDDAESRVDYYGPGPQPTVTI